MSRMDIRIEERKEQENKKKYREASWNYNKSDKSENLHILTKQNTIT
jgi:hypothetical protein